MCGIAGILDFSNSSSSEELGSQVMAMASTLAHRGPDSSGFWEDSNAGIALGHQRLAIMDLSTFGHQPMASSNGRYIISYNGEIYQFNDLRNRLINHGIKFKGSSDTEVILGAIEAFGIDRALSEFIGMFSFALWDRENRQLHLVRDRLGIKPLYYGRYDNYFLFGSELHALGAHKSCSKIINHEAIAAYMRCSYIPAPWSIWEGTYKLEPGGHLIIDSNGKEENKIYWSLNECILEGSKSSFSGTKSDAFAVANELINNAVSSRMVADVPVGLLLSGGIDSSTVAAIAQSNSTNKINTFSIGFKDATYDESHLASSVANHLGTNHTDLIITENDVHHTIPTMASIYDEPFADSSQIPTFLVCKLARKDVTVCLTGDGGDEIFAGYNRHRIANYIDKFHQQLPYSARYNISKLLTSLPLSVSNNLFKGISPFLPNSLKFRDPAEKIRKFAVALKSQNTSNLYRNLSEQWETDVLLNNAKEPDLLVDNPSLWPNLPDLSHQLLYLDTATYLPNDILTKVDRASMAVSLEARVPLLDHRVVEFAWSLPPELRTKTSESKWILRKILRNFIPENLLTRPKWGFAMPIGQWLRGSLRDWAEDLISYENLKKQEIFKPEKVRNIWLNHLSGKSNEESKLWTVLMLSSWLNNQ